MSTRQKNRSDKSLGAHLRDAGLTALICLPLAFPMFGFQLVPGGEGGNVKTFGTSVELRFFWVISALIVIFLGRLLISVLSSKAVIKRVSGAQTSIADAEFMSNFRQWIGPGMLTVALLWPWFPFVDRWLVDLGILVLTYIMLGWGLNIVVGLAGLLDLGYVAFYAVGAYSYALIALNFDLTFWQCLPLAGIFAAIFGILLGFPVLRLRGDYLAIVTLGFGEIIRIVLLNWSNLTNGPDGLSGIPRPTFFGLPFKNDDSGTNFHSYFGLEYTSMHRIIFLYYLILILALITNFVTERIRILPVGRAWEALREDEIACRSLGINPRNTKLTAFAIGAMFAGFAGSFFATRQAFISPESFTFIESAIILAIVVLGGMGSQMGVVLAAIFLIGMTELFRELEQFRMLAFGAGMVAIMVWRPRGLLTQREPSVRIAKTAKVR